MIFAIPFFLFNFVEELVWFIYFMNNYSENFYLDFENN